jgi:hypothetical protein
MDAKDAFGLECTKFAGAITAEWLRQALKVHGIPISRRDVFIRGVPIELDLVIPKGPGSGILDLLYEPADVAAVIEVKTHGIIGKPALDRVCKTFADIRGSCAGIRCAYVTLTERDSYRWKATSENLKADVFTLFYDNSDRGDPPMPTGDWERFIAFARGAVNGRSRPSVGHKSNA